MSKPGLDELRRKKAEVDKKLHQCENQQKILQNKIRDKERRQRTRRLIEHGAILESVFPVKDMDGEEIKALLKQIALLPEVTEVMETFKNDEGRGT